MQEDAKKDAQTEINRLKEALDGMSQSKVATAVVLYCVLTLCLKRCSPHREQSMKEFARRRVQLS